MSGYESTKTRGQVTAQDQFHRRQCKRQRAAVPPQELYSVPYIASRENLFQVATELSQRLRCAPGRDGIRAENLTRSEIGQIAGCVSQKVLDGSYRPHKSKLVRIPKPDSDETRTIQVSNFWDKVISSALNKIVSPLLDGQLLDVSYGFRPERNLWRLLADLKVQAEAEDLWVLAIDDVRKAFDTVVIADVIDAFRQLLEQQKHLVGDYAAPGGLLELVEKVLRGNNPRNEVGIRQGDPFSPLALNVLLHVNHDVLFKRNATKPFWLRFTKAYRYADNLIYLNQNVNEGLQALQHARHLCRIRSLELKGKDGVYDLNAGDTAQLLGFILQRTGNEMTFDLDFMSLGRLRKSLANAHRKPNPIYTANESLRGWVSSMGPAFKQSGILLPMISLITSRLGLREAFNMKELEKLWAASRTAWDNTLAAAWKRYMKGVCG